MTTKYTRCLSTSCCPLKNIKLNLKGRGKSSQEWLLRQAKDPYVEKARMENYRCRSAFKLLEIDAKHNILQPGFKVIDCGAAPGSWTQVAVIKTNALGKDVTKPQGLVLAIDRLPIHPIEGATVIGGCDFTDAEARRRLQSHFEPHKADLVMSDMAPNATGVKSMDHEAIVDLVYLFLRFALYLSSEGSAILLKVWEGGRCPKLEEDLHRFYTHVKWVKPPSSRSDSSETFLLGKGFKGLITP